MDQMTVVLRRHSTVDVPPVPAQLSRPTPPKTGLSTDFQTFGKGLDEHSSGPLG